MRDPDGSGVNVFPVPPPTGLPAASSSTIERRVFVSVINGVVFSTSPSTSPTQPASDSAGTIRTFANSGRLCGCFNW